MSKKEISYKLVDGIQGKKIQDRLLRKGADLTLKRVIDVCRADEAEQMKQQIMR